ncbi:sugar transferase [Aequorivita marisscotiae]|uniref:Sugar transferase n=1 Tax=Aequorivita marisscotiae TaxID=3040348 RepID=A0ABY8KWT8_9FLAO|nr:sugar transferase [Aequorivita sp. Ant34-E75]WGF92202.1 sugar transferase [Aequorivita sp. Ant34-E75]
MKVKRLFDIIVSFIGLMSFWWLIILAALISKLDTGLSGFFIQTRVGRDAKLFKLIKIRTMRHIPGIVTTVTTDGDPRISKIGRFWRKTKIDELPQLWNVLLGDMSFVGPRPDVPGLADKLEGEERLILKIRPGITGPASIIFKNEEVLLAKQEDPEKYNIEVIWPEKVRLNIYYINNYSLVKDIGYIIDTIFQRD